MTAYPTNYDKEVFIKFLEKINANEKTIKRIKELPDSVKKNGNEYQLYIVSTYHTEGKTSYSFELNYYSKDLVEFLFSYKILNNVEDSINYLFCELVKGHYLNQDSTPC